MDPSFRWDDRVKVWDDRVKVWDDSVKVWDDSVKVWDDNVKVWDDSVKVWDDRVKVWDDSVKLDYLVLERTKIELSNWRKAQSVMFSYSIFFHCLNVSFSSVTSILMPRI